MEKDQFLLSELDGSIHDLWQQIESMAPEWQQGDPKREAIYLAYISFYDELQQVKMGVIEGAGGYENYVITDFGNSAKVSQVLTEQNVTELLTDQLLSLKAVGEENGHPIWNSIEELSPEQLGKPMYMSANPALRLAHFDNPTVLDFLIQMDYLELHIVLDFQKYLFQQVVVQAEN